MFTDGGLNWAAFHGMRRLSAAMSVSVCVMFVAMVASVAVMTASGVVLHRLHWNCLRELAGTRDRPAQGGLLKAKRQMDIHKFE